MEWGPKTVVIKRGEYGALVYQGDMVFFSPAMPMERVVDPTGAGDTFAGGFMGYVAKACSSEAGDLKRAAVLGGVMASFQVEDFGLDRMRRLTHEEIDRRFGEFSELASFDRRPVFSE
jgi:sugar/nucleoside kinase (ribokinase family)